MQKLPAITGWLWIKEGYALFRKQPFEMISLLFAYIIVTLAIASIPVAGRFILPILVPALSMAFLQAGADIEQGKRVYPTTLFTAFRSRNLVPLLTLGVMYLVAIFIVSRIAFLFDDGTILKMAAEKTEFDPMVFYAHLMPVTLIGATIFTPAAMAFWYAPPLVIWKDMSAFKAAFYSFFAVWKASAPFLVYALVGGALFTFIFMFFGMIVGSIIILLFGNTVASLAMILFLCVLSSIAYCSFYPNYTSVFGKPYSPDDAQALRSDS